jgi:LysR family glycine cleavage system transcriptional activator
MAHPELAVRMSTSNDIVDLKAGDADIAIRAGPGHWPGLETHKLFESQFTPMASPECLAAEERKLGRKLQPSDMPTAHIINPGDDWWQQWFCDNGVAPDEKALRRPGIRLDNQANEGHAAMAGQGFALLTPFLWQGDVAAGRLVVPFPESISARGWAYWLVLPPERRMVPKVKRFRECCSRSWKRQGNPLFRTRRWRLSCASRPLGRRFDRVRRGRQVAVPAIPRSARPG